jgi:hypothetical protein
MWMKRLWYWSHWLQRWTCVQTRCNCKTREAQKPASSKRRQTCCECWGWPLLSCRPDRSVTGCASLLADQGALPFTSGTAAGDVGVPVAWRAWLRQETSSMCVTRLDVSDGAGGSLQPVTANLASPLSAFAVCHLPSRLTGWNQCDGCRAWLVRPRMQKPPCLCRPLQQQAASLNPVFSAAAGPQAKALPCVAPH